MDQPVVNTSFGEYQTPHKDLREWLGRIEGIGELKVIEGADWNLEIGAIAEMIYHANSENPPALLFEKIPGYPDDFKVLSGMTNSAGRLAVTLGMPKPNGALDVVQGYRDRLKDFELHPATTVTEGAGNGPSLTAGMLAPTRSQRSEKKTVPRSSRSVSRRPGIEPSASR